MNTEITNVPFPSVTICPSNRVDWNEAAKIKEALISPDDEEANLVFEELLRRISSLQYTDLDKLKPNASDAVLGKLDRNERNLNNAN